MGKFPVVGYLKRERARRIVLSDRVCPSCGRGRMWVYVLPRTHLSAKCSKCVYVEVRDVGGGV